MAGSGRAGKSHVEGLGKEAVPEGPAMKDGVDALRVEAGSAQAGGQQLVAVSVGNFIVARLWHGDAGGRVQSVAEVFLE